MEQTVAIWKKRVGWRNQGSIISGIEYGISKMIENFGGRSPYKSTMEKLAAASTHGGDFDFKKRLSADTLYEINNVYYNKNEAGNFWWGYAAASLNLPMADLFLGADSFSIAHGLAYNEPWEVDAWMDGFIYYFGHINPDVLIPHYNREFGGNRINMYARR